MIGYGSLSTMARAYGTPEEPASALSPGGPSLSSAAVAPNHTADPPTGATENGGRRCLSARRFRFLRQQHAVGQICVSASLRPSTPSWTTGRSICWWLSSA